MVKKQPVDQRTDVCIIEEFNNAKPMELSFKEIVEIMG